MTVNDSDCNSDSIPTNSNSIDDQDDRREESDGARESTTIDDDNVQGRTAGTQVDNTSS